MKTSTNSPMTTSEDPRYTCMVEARRPPVTVSEPSYRDTRQKKVNSRSRDILILVARQFYVLFFYFLLFLFFFYRECFYVYNV